MYITLHKHFKNMTHTNYRHVNDTIEMYQKSMWNIRHTAGLKESNKLHPQYIDLYPINICLPKIQFTKNVNC